MLKPAINYEGHINKLIAETVLDKKYEFFFLGYEQLSIEIDETMENEIQMVSVNNKGEVIGFLEAIIERPENFVSDLAIINFTDNTTGKALFARDLLRFLKYLTKYKKFKKINFSGTVGNPATDKYIKLVKKFSGRIVGTKKCNILINNKYYDTIDFEWINDYYECSICNNKIKNRDNVTCNKCGIGEMEYITPF